MKINPATRVIFNFIFYILLFKCCKNVNNEEEIFKKGTLSIYCHFDFISIDENLLKNTNKFNDLKIKIINAIDNSEVRIFKISQFYIDSIELMPGKYYIIAETDKVFSAAFDVPAYYGMSSIFEIKPQAYLKVDVNCKVSNCAITVKYSENVKNQFLDYYTILSNKDTFLIYSKNEARQAFFKLDQINIKANLIYIEDGIQKTKIIQGKLSSPEQGMLYNITINASLNKTASGLTVFLDSTLVPQQIIINDSNSKNLFYGKILITEIMYDPDSIDDSKGEWFEIFNNSDDTINLKNFVIRSGSKYHCINEDLYLVPKSYFLFEKSEIATPFKGYVYGSSLTFNNTGIVDITIATYGTNGLDGDIVATVAYGTGTFMPKATGASLNLSGDCFSIESLSNKDCWCLSDSVYDGINKGTPGFQNKNCN